jgi:hypothetical protein
VSLSDEDRSVLSLALRGRPRADRGVLGPRHCRESGYFLIGLFASIVAAGIAIGLGTLIGGEMAVGRMSQVTFGLFGVMKIGLFCG